MRQFNIEIDKTSPKTSRFVVPASEHFSILVRYKNWKDKQEWLDYTLVDDAGTGIVKYKKEAENDSVLYFCSYIDKSTNLRFKTSTLASTLAPRDIVQMVAIASSTQDNCYVCSANSANSISWSGIEGKPTSLSGYGITDAATKDELDSLSAVVGTANTQLEEIA